MRPIDDSENPYAGKYAEWDKWCYAHAVKNTANLYNREPQPGWVMLSVGVDEKGYPVPLTEADRQQYKYYDNLAKAAGQSGKVEESRCVLSYSAYGEMDPALKQQMLDAQMAVKAQFVPPVPRWLAEQPPYWALTLPDSQVVALGEPGTGKDFNLDRLDRSKGPFGDTKNDGYRYYLYSGKGKLLKKTEPGQHWVELFWPGFEQELIKDATNRYVWARMGIVTVQDAFNPSALAIYDYTGRKLDDKAQTPYASRNFTVWTGLYGQELESIYKAQHRK